MWHVGRIDWLRGLPEEQQELLESDAELRRYLPGDMIFGPDKEPEFVYVLEQGLVRIFRLSRGGAEVQFGHVLPGEIFGELALFLEEPRESFAQAAQKSAVWRITREKFQQVLKSSPAVMFEVSRQMGGRFKRIESRVEDLVFRSARSRLARMLLQLVDDFGAPEGEGIAITIPLTQSELAVLIGATRQTVNVSLAQMREEGLIEYDGHDFRLVDPAALCRLAEQSPG